MGNGVMESSKTRRERGCSRESVEGRVIIADKQLSKHAFGKSDYAVRLGPGMGTSGMAKNEDSRENMFAAPQ